MDQWLEVVQLASTIVFIEELDSLICQFNSNRVCSSRPVTGHFYRPAHGNVLNQTSVRPDVPLLGYDASPTTYDPSFLKKTSHLFISIHSFLFLSLLSDRLPPPSARSLALRGVVRDRLRGTLLGHWPCQAHCAATSKSRHSAADPARCSALQPSPSCVANASLP
jgi:hypothetical protein